MASDSRPVISPFPPASPESGSDLPQGVLCPNRPDHQDEIIATLALLAMNGLSGRHWRGLLCQLLPLAGSAVQLRRCLEDKRWCREQDPALLALQPAASASELQHQIDACRAAALKLLRVDAPCYPATLRAIPDPPVVLFVAGNPALLSRPGIAVVGSRQPTPPGRHLAETLARDLAGAGLNVISGLALGIDAAAHRGALAAPGLTTAVLGGGHASLYPRRHRPLAADILAAGGALVSEYTPQAQPRKHQFPERNRLISGLSAGALVVEASERSGSLITARLALEQGRDVMAVPGPVASALSRGCHRLIKEGAALVENSNDVLSQLGLTAWPSELPAQAALPGLGASAADATQSAALDPLERQVLQAVDYQLTDFDVLCSRTSLPTDVLLRCLGSLTLKGFVDDLAGGYIRRPR